MTYQVIVGDNLDAMRTMPDNSVDAIVTDPPAGISFMNKAFDHDRGGRDEWVAWLADVFREAYRVAKPGGHAFVWALPRTSGWTHRALEDAGWEIRDCCVHLFGSGFPKSRRVDMDEQFCHCDASVHTSSHTFPAQQPDDRTHMMAGVVDDDPLSSGAHRSTHRLSGSRGDCLPDRGFDDEHARSAEADAQASALLQGCVPARSHSDEREDGPACESSRSPSPARRIDHPSSLDSANLGISAAYIPLDIQVNKAESASTPTLTGSALSASHTSHTASQSGAYGTAFPYNCTTCGKPIAKGFGTSLKPAAEFWYLARKPLIGTVAANVMQHGTGALNIAATRIKTTDNLNGGAYAATGTPRDDGWGMQRAGAGEYEQPEGRWPANVALSHTEDCREVGVKRVKGNVCSGTTKKQTNGYEGGWGDLPLSDKHYADPDGYETVPAWDCAPDCPVAMLDAQSGERKSGGKAAGTYHNSGRSGGIMGDVVTRHATNSFEPSTGSASRFFFVAPIDDPDADLTRFRYQPKASRSERNAGLGGPDGVSVNAHPT